MLSATTTRDASLAALTHRAGTAPRPVLWASNVYAHATTRCMSALASSAGIAGMTLVTESAVGANGSGALLNVALRRFWRLTVLLAVIGAGAGVAAGLVGKPTYTSTSEYLVGSPSVDAQAVPGYVVATQSLAASYSRAAGTALLFDPIARQLNLTPTIVGSRLAVLPVPESNVINVIATAPSPGAARDLAAVAGTQLVRLVSETQMVKNRAPLFLRQFEQAERAVLDAETRLRNLKLRLGATTPATTYVSVETAIAVAQLQAQTLSNEYVQAQEASFPAAGLELLSPASAANSNRHSTIERAALAGLVGGLVLGAILSYALEARRRRIRVGMA